MKHYHRYLALFHSTVLTIKHRLKMSTRRSARLRAQPTQEPLLAPDSPAEEEPKKRSKQKVPATKRDNEPTSKRKMNEVVSSDSVVQPPAKARKKDTGAGVTKTSKSFTHRPAITTSDALSSLPAEVLNMVLKNVSWINDDDHTRLLTMATRSTIQNRSES